MHLISEAAVQNELNKNPLKTQDKEKTSEQEPEREQDQEIEQVQLEGNIDSLELLKEAGDAVENTNTTSTTNDQVNTPSDGKEDNKTQDETNYSVKDFTGDGWEPCNEVWHVYKNYYPGDNEDELQLWAKDYVKVSYKNNNTGWFYGTNYSKSECKHQACIKNREDPNKAEGNSSNRNTANENKSGYFKSEGFVIYSEILESTTGGPQRDELIINMISKEFEKYSLIGTNISKPNKILYKDDIGKAKGGKIIDIERNQGSTEKWTDSEKQQPTVNFIIESTENNSIVKKDSYDIQKWNDNGVGQNWSENGEYDEITRNQQFSIVNSNINLLKDVVNKEEGNINNNIANYYKYSQSRIFTYDIPSIFSVNNFITLLLWKDLLISYNYINNYLGKKDPSIDDSLNPSTNLKEYLKAYETNYNINLLNILTSGLKELKGDIYISDKDPLNVNSVIDALKEEDIDEDKINEFTTLMRSPEFGEYLFNSNSRSIMESNIVNVFVELNKDTSSIVQEDESAQGSNSVNINKFESLMDTEMSMFNTLPYDGSVMKPLLETLGVAGAIFNIAASFLKAKTKSYMNLINVKGLCDINLLVDLIDLMKKCSILNISFKYEINSLLLIDELEQLLPKLNSVVNTLSNKIKGDISDRINKELISYKTLEKTGVYNGLIKINKSNKYNSTFNDILNDKNCVNFIVVETITPISTPVEEAVEGVSEVDEEVSGEVEGMPGAVESVSDKPVTENLVTAENIKPPQIEGGTTSEQVELSSGKLINFENDILTKVTQIFYYSMDISNIYSILYENRQILSYICGLFQINLQNNFNLDITEDKFINDRYIKNIIDSIIKVVEDSKNILTEFKNYDNISDELKNNIDKLSIIVHTRFNIIDIEQNNDIIDYFNLFMPVSIFKKNYDENNQTKFTIEKNIYNDIFFKKRILKIKNLLKTEYTETDELIYYVGSGLLKDVLKYMHFLFSNPLLIHHSELNNQGKWKIREYKEGPAFDFTKYGFNSLNYNVRDLKNIPMLNSKIVLDYNTFYGTYNYNNNFTLDKYGEYINYYKNKYYYVGNSLDINDKSLLKISENDIKINNDEILIKHKNLIDEKFKLVESRLSIVVNDETIKNYLTIRKYKLNFDICKLIIFNLVKHETKNYTFRYGRTNIFMVQFVLFCFMYIYSVKCSDNKLYYDIIYDIFLLRDRIINCDRSIININKIEPCKENPDNKENLKKLRDFMNTITNILERIFALSTVICVNKTIMPYHSITPENIKNIYDYYVFSDNYKRIHSNNGKNDIFNNIISVNKNLILGSRNKTGFLQLVKRRYNTDRTESSLASLKKIKENNLYNIDLASLEYYNINKSTYNDDLNKILKYLDNALTDTETPTINHFNLNDISELKFENNVIYVIIYNGDTIDNSSVIDELGTYDSIKCGFHKLSATWRSAFGSDVIKEAVEPDENYKTYNHLLYIKSSEHSNCEYIILTNLQPDDVKSLISSIKPEEKNSLYIVRDESVIINTHNNYDIYNLNIPLTTVDRLRNKVYDAFVRTNTLHTSSIGLVQKGEQTIGDESVTGVEIKLSLTKTYTLNKNLYFEMLKELNSKIFSTLILFSNEFIKTVSLPTGAFQFAQTMKLQKFKEQLVFNYRKLKHSNVDSYIDDVVNNYSDSNSDLKIYYSKSENISDKAKLKKKTKNRKKQNEKRKTYKKNKDNDKRKTYKKKKAIDKKKINQLTKLKDTKIKN